MGKEAFKEINFKQDTLAVIARANQIIAEYQKQNLRLTLRQLYYQFVSRNWVQNTERSYKNLGNMISDGRLAGLIDWDALEDRGREVMAPASWSSIKDMVEQRVYQFRLDRWEGQEKYVELMVEKQALAGIMWQIAAEFHVPLNVNKGYSSQTAMYECSQRFSAAEAEGKEGVIIYVGDQDPSGDDMPRDVNDRMRVFTTRPEVVKIALTMDQVEEYKPPPNPAKMSDSRAEGYVAKYGKHSWEVDALKPDVLRGIIVDEIYEHLDKSMMDKIIAEEEIQKRKLRKALESMKL